MIPYAKHSADHSSLSETNKRPRSVTRAFASAIVEMTGVQRALELTSQRRVGRKPVHIAHHQIVSGTGGIGARLNSTAAFPSPAMAHYRYSGLRLRADQSAMTPSPGHHSTKMSSERNESAAD